MILTKLELNIVRGANPTKWSNTLKQFVSKLPRNCLSMFDHFVGLALKGITFLNKLFCLRETSYFFSFHGIFECLIILKIVYVPIIMTMTFFFWLWKIKFLIVLTLSWRRPLSYRNQSIDFSANLITNCSQGRTLCLGLKSKVSCPYRVSSLQEYSVFSHQAKWLRTSCSNYCTNFRGKQVKEKETKIKSWFVFYKKFLLEVKNWEKSWQRKKK